MCLRDDKLFTAVPPCFPPDAGSRIPTDPWPVTGLTVIHYSLSLWQTLLGNQSFSAQSPGLHQPPVLCASGTETVFLHCIYCMQFTITPPPPSMVLFHRICGKLLDIYTLIR